MLQYVKLINKIKVTKRYFTFEKEKVDQKYKSFLENVLHHLGDDYGNNEISLNKAKKEMILTINRLADKASVIVFQIGLNWKGKI